MKLILLFILVTHGTAGLVPNKKGWLTSNDFLSHCHYASTANQPRSLLANPSIDDDSYYDGDQPAPESMDPLQAIDCSNQCPPHWNEPVLQQKQTLVYPTSASVSLKCPYRAKPKARITWFKDGQLFTPELQELVSDNVTGLLVCELPRFALVRHRWANVEYLQSDDVRCRNVQMPRWE